VGGVEGHELGVAGPVVREPDDLVAHRYSPDAGTQLNYRADVTVELPFGPHRPWLMADLEISVCQSPSGEIHAGVPK
jgi:hypothetical protein